MHRITAYLFYGRSKYGPCLIGHVLLMLEMNTAQVWAVDLEREI